MGRWLRSAALGLVRASGELSLARRPYRSGAWVRFVILRTRRSSGSCVPFGAIVRAHAGSARRLGYDRAREAKAVASSWSWRDSIQWSRLAVCTALDQSLYEFDPIDKPMQGFGYPCAQAPCLGLAGGSFDRRHGWQQPPLRPRRPRSRRAGPSLIGRAPSGPAPSCAVMVHGACPRSTGAGQARSSDSLRSSSAELAADASSFTPCSAYPAQHCPETAIRCALRCL